MPLRVLLLNYDYPPYGGGVGMATEMLARSLAGRGLRVDVVAAGSRDEVSSELLWDGAADEEGVLTVHRVRCRRASGYLIAARPVVRRLLREHDYQVAHFCSTLPTAVLLPLLDLRGVPVLVSLRGSDVPGYDAHDAASARAQRLLSPLTRWIWRRADRVIAPSDDLGALGLRTLPHLRYSVIHCGVDLLRFRPSPRRRFASNPVRCLAVGRLVERKGLRDLLRAMALLERGRFRLDIVGSGPEEKVLRTMVAELGIADEVRFLGRLDRSAVARCYREADLFTLPPRSGSTGSVFAEALASGLPIVGTRVTGIAELVEHELHGLLVPPAEPAALADAIRTLGDDPRRRREIARRNRLRAEAALDWRHVTARYLSIYRGVQRLHPARAVTAELPSGTW